MSDQHQSDLPEIDLLDNGALWEIAHSELSAGDVTRLIWLLEKNTDRGLVGREQAELASRMAEADQLNRRKAAAIALLRQRGYDMPATDDI